MGLLIDTEELHLMKGGKNIQTPPKRKTEKEIDYSVTIPENRRIQVNRVQTIPSNNFSPEDFPRGLNFYDFEVFRFDWFVTIINPIERQKRIIVNNTLALKDYFKEHRNEIWVGYNSTRYDVFILKAILCGLNPKKINDDIIIRDIRGNRLHEDFRKITVLDYDCYNEGRGSLKVLEAFRGSDIQESEVDFNLDRLLTREEVEKVIRYNIHDVEETIEVFQDTVNEFNSKINLIDTFALPIENISKTQMRNVCDILECEPISRNDDFDLKIVPTLKLRKYRYVQSWYEDEKNLDYKKSLDVDVCGVPHKFGWGGLHGAPEEPIHRKGKIFHVDVNSYYPSIMLRYGFLTRNSKNKKKYEAIYKTRLELKKAGKKKEQEPYKIVLNGTYGICKDNFSLAYDPRNANNICVNGQLMLLDLLERLEPYIELIQSNTDGIILLVRNEGDTDKVLSICHRWEERTGMGLGFDEISEIFQKDVNNYIFRFTSGKIERKGSYVMNLDDLNYDLAIVNEALVKYLMEKIPVEETIMECNDFRKFQKVVKVSSKYNGAYHNGVYLKEKVLRVFASRNHNDGFVGKYKFGKNIEKFANTPDHAFIDNSAIRGKEVPTKLNKNWYIELAKSKLEDFGIKVNRGGLF